MKESKEVKQLRSKILEIELELSILSKDLERYKNEHVYNTKLLSVLDENLFFLKNNDVTISIEEFKKIRQQKDIVLTRLAYYESKIKPLEQILDVKEGFQKKQMERFEHFYRMQFKNNILEFPSDRRKKA